MDGERQGRTGGQDTSRYHHHTFARSGRQIESSMKLPLFVTALFVSSTLLAAEPPARNEANVSVRNEVLISIDKGLAWLKQQQKEDGSIANPENGDPAAEHPALTALPLIAFYREP